MPLITVRNDITNMRVDAIVNAANASLLGGGGVDGAIHKKAGKELLEECKTLGGCSTGSAKITLGYNLPCKYVIHTVGPVYKDGLHGEREALVSCYKKSLLLAKEHNCETVAFPLISAGAYGYPKMEAIQIASSTITEFLNDNDMTVYLVVFDKAAYTISRDLFKDIAAYIDDTYAGKALKLNRNRKEVYEEHCMMSAPCSSYAPCEYSFDTSLDDEISMIDESFSEMLLRKIDECGMTDVQCYKRANIDRKLFSKIRSDKLYKPTKRTAIAFALALELDIDETHEMLLKAGFALSHSNKFDIIIEYFIKHKNYNVFEINEALFAFDQPLLGT